MRRWLLRGLEWFRKALLTTAGMMLALLAGVVGIAALVQFAVLIYWSISTFWFALVALPIAWGLFALRCSQRSFYGLVEVIVGIVTVLNAFPGVKALWEAVRSMGVGQATQSSPALAIVAAIYIIIRGLDNIDQGLPAFRTSSLNPFDHDLLEFYWEVGAKLRWRRKKRIKIYSRLAARRIREVAAERDAIVDRMYAADPEEPRLPPKTPRIKGIFGMAFGMGKIPLLRLSHRYKTHNQLGIREPQSKLE